MTIVKRDDLYTISKARELLGVSKNKMWRLVRDGRHSPTPSTSVKSLSDALMLRSWSDTGMQAPRIKLIFTKALSSESM